MSNRYITSILSLVAAASVNAQDLTTEITVDRTVVTELPAAAPLSSVFPSLPKNNGNMFGVKPVMYTQWTEFKPVASDLNTPLYTGFTPAPGYRGYVLGGYFPAYNAEAAAGYRFIDTKDSQLGASARFNGYSYKYQENKITDNTFSAQIGGSHRFSFGAVFAANADFMHAGLKSFGTDRGVNGFRFNAGVYSQQKYRLKVGFDYFGLNDAIPVSVSGQYDGKPRDMRFTAEGGYVFSFGDATDFDFGVKGDVLNRKDVMDNFNETGDYSFTSFLFTLNPALRYSTDNFKARIGVSLSMAHKTATGKFCLAPDVMLAWMPSGIVDIYALARGGRDIRGLRWQYEISPFSTGAEAESMAKSPVDARAGINLRPSSGLKVGIFAGYSYWKNLMVLQRYNAWQSTGDFTRLPLNYHDFELKGFNYGFEASYEVAPWGSVRLDGTFYAEGDPALADRAKAVLNAGVTLRPVARLTVDADYRLRSSRRYISYSYIHNNLDNSNTLQSDYSANLGSVSDLCIGANYEVTPQFSAFLRLENILGHRYQIIPDLYSRTIHGLLGVSYVF